MNSPWVGILLGVAFVGSLIAYLYLINPNRRD